MGHFGGYPQPYSDKAMDWLKTKILDRQIWCQVLRRDQYNRIVNPSPVTIPRFTNSFSAIDSESSDEKQNFW
jgi:hypothetical protein